MRRYLEAKSRIALEKNKNLQNNKKDKKCIKINLCLQNYVNYGIKTNVYEYDDWNDKIFNEIWFNQIVDDEIIVKNYIYPD